MQIDPISHRAMATRVANRRAPWKRIVRALQELAGAGAEFVRHSEKPWASVTFSGARHTIALAFEGAEAMEAADLFIAALPDHEFSLGDKLVADATVVSVEQTVLPSPRTLVEAELLILDDV
ncbi:MAG: hypothetical protein KDE32_11085 [Novosphingobium sp.]|nr:hypothetical protein [Novosphingobium sp.]